MTTKDKGNCFVVMPFGRDEEEVAWFAGWYKECLVKGIEKSGYNCVLSAAEHKPIAINDDIRAHLVLDPMVLCDLGGMAPGDPPNPNVMYELGIRHAFGHPLVIMGWKGQRLPFDVANQRIILENRRFLDIETNIERIVDFVAAAERGDYYRPMEAVGRRAALNLSTEPITRDTVLKNLVREVASLKDVIGARPTKTQSEKQKPAGIKSYHSQIYHALGTREHRVAVRALLEARGIKKAQFDKIVTHLVPADILPSALTWDDPTWTDYLAHRIAGTPFDAGRWAAIEKSPTRKEIAEVPAIEAPASDDKVPEPDVRPSGT